MTRDQDWTDADEMEAIIAEEVDGIRSCLREIAGLCSGDRRYDMPFLTATVELGRELVQLDVDGLTNALRRLKAADRARQAGGR